MDNSIGGGGAIDGDFWVMSGPRRQGVEQITLRFADSEGAAKYWNWRRSQCCIVYDYNGPGPRRIALLSPTETPGLHAQNVVYVCEEYESTEFGEWSRVTLPVCAAVLQYGPLFTEVVAPVYEGYIDRADFYELIYIVDELMRPVWEQYE
ncbi:MAG: hypothetical protein HC802_21785 [Caldilineaceae bacterium]|nr:hypothetical protein [Caldilineaceae bacterium]